MNQTTMTEKERLSARCAEMAKQGLVDIKIALDDENEDDLTDTTVESVCAEVNDLLDAYERGEGTELSFGDSHGLKVKAP